MNCRQRQSKQAGTQEGMLVSNGMMPSESTCLQSIGRRGEYYPGFALIEVTEERTANKVV